MNSRVKKIMGCALVGTLSLGIFLTPVTPAWASTQAQIAYYQVDVPWIEEQAAVEAKLQADFAKGNYLWQINDAENASIYTIINPYGEAPLAALAMFDTDKACKVSVSVKGRARSSNASQAAKEIEATTIEYSFKTVDTHHEIPIYGLFGVGKTYVTLTLEDAQGKILSTKEITLEANLGEQSYRGQENYWANLVKMSYYTAETTNLKLVEGEQQYYINLNDGGSYVCADKGDAGADIYSSEDTSANFYVSMSTSGASTNEDIPYLKYEAEVVPLSDEDVKEYNYFPGLTFVSVAQDSNNGLAPMKGFDVYGNLRSVLNCITDPNPVRQTSNGHFISGLKYANDKNCAIVEFDGLGKFYNVWLAETYHHEFIYDEENNIMSIDSASINTAGQNQYVYRIDSETGEFIEDMALMDIMEMTGEELKDMEGYDTWAENYKNGWVSNPYYSANRASNNFAHINSFTYALNDDGSYNYDKLLVSTRANDALIMIDQEKNEVAWYIGHNNKQYSDSMKAKELVPVMQWKGETVKVSDWWKEQTGLDVNFSDPNDRYYQDYWTLGREGYYEKYGVKDVPFEFPYGNHAISTIPSGEFKGDYFYFNNGNGRSTLDEYYISSDELVAEAIKGNNQINYSQGIIYHVDEEAGTVEQKYTFGKDLGLEYHSAYICDVDYLGQVGDYEYYIIHHGGPQLANFAFGSEEEYFENVHNYWYPEGVGQGGKVSTTLGHRSYTYQVRRDVNTGESKIVWTLKLFGQNQYRTQRMPVYGQDNNDEVWYSQGEIKATPIGELYTYRPYVAEVSMNDMNLNVGEKETLSYSLSSNYKEGFDGVVHSDPFDPTNAEYNTLSGESFSDLVYMTYTSSDPSVVSVDENGVLKAIKEGTATITATLKGSMDKEDTTKEATATSTITVGSSEVVLTIGAKECMVNGTSKTMDAIPYVDSNGSVMVPIRFIAETLGADVVWDEADHDINIISQDKKTNSRLTIAQNSYSINNTAKNMDSAPVINNGRAMVPISILAESLDADVSLDNNIVTIIVE